MSDTFLQDYKTELKLAATKNLEKTIGKTFRIITDRSKLKNDIILLQARYQELEKEIIKGIVAEPDRVLRTNRIMDSFFQLVDNLQITDVQKSDDEALNQFIAKQTPPIAAEESSLPTESSPTSVRSVPAFKESAPLEAPSKTISDLDLFTELNRNPISFYPVVYRDIRNLIIRNSSSSQEIVDLIVLIEQHLPTLQQFKNKVDLLEPLIKKIRLDFNNRPYWMQYKQISNQRTTLKLDTLETINKMNNRVEEFSQILKEKGLL